MYSNRIERRKLENANDENKEIKRLLKRESIRLNTQRDDVFKILDGFESPCWNYFEPPIGMRVRCSQLGRRDRVINDNYIFVKPSRSRQDIFLKETRWSSIFKEGNNRSFEPTLNQMKRDNTFDKIFTPTIVFHKVDKKTEELFKAFVDVPYLKKEALKKYQVYCEEIKKQMIETKKRAIEDLEKILESQIDTFEKEVQNRFKTQKNVIQNFSPEKFKEKIDNVDVVLSEESTPMTDLIMKCSDVFQIIFSYLCQKDIFRGICPSATFFLKYIKEKVPLTIEISLRTLDTIPLDDILHGFTIEKLVLGNEEKDRNVRHIKNFIRIENLFQNHHNNIKNLDISVLEDCQTGLVLPRFSEEGTNFQEYQKTMRKSRKKSYENALCLFDEIKSFHFLESLRTQILPNEMRSLKNLKTLIYPIDYEIMEGNAHSDDMEKKILEHRFVGNQRIKTDLKVLTDSLMAKNHPKLRKIILFDRNIHTHSFPGYGGYTIRSLFIDLYNSIIKCLPDGLDEFSTRMTFGFDTFSDEFLDYLCTKVNIINLYYLGETEDRSGGSGGSGIFGSWGEEKLYGFRRSRNHRWETNEENNTKKKRSTCSWVCVEEDEEGQFKERINGWGGRKINLKKKAPKKKKKKKIKKKNKKIVEKKKEIDGTDNSYNTVFRNISSNQGGGSNWSSGRSKRRQREIQPSFSEVDFLLEEEMKEEEKEEEDRHDRNVEDDRNKKEEEEEEKQEEKKEEEEKKDEEYAKEEQNTEPQQPQQQINQVHEVGGIGGGWWGDIGGGNNNNNWGENQGTVWKTNESRENLQSLEAIEVEKSFQLVLLKIQLFRKSMEKRESSISKEYKNSFIIHDRRDSGMVHSSLDTSDKSTMFMNQVSYVPNIILNFPFLEKGKRTIFPPNNNDDGVLWGNDDGIWGNQQQETMTADGIIRVGSSKLTDIIRNLKFSCGGLIFTTFFSGERIADPFGKLPINLSHLETFHDHANTFTGVFEDIFLKKDCLKFVQFNITYNGRGNMECSPQRIKNHRLGRFEFGESNQNTTSKIDYKTEHAQTVEWNYNRSICFLPELLFKNLLSKTNISINSFVLQIAFSRESAIRVEDLRKFFMSEVIPFIKRYGEVKKNETELQRSLKLTVVVEEIAYLKVVERDDSSEEEESDGIDSEEEEEFKMEHETIKLDVKKIPDEEIENGVIDVLKEIKDDVMNFFNGETSHVYWKFELFLDVRYLQKMELQKKECRCNYLK